MTKLTIDDLGKMIKDGFDGQDEKIEGVKKELKKELGKELGKVRADMVTKNYLDEKLADLRGDLVVLMRKEDRKLKTLIEILKERKIISKGDEKRILSMEPFPELSLRLEEGG